MSQLRTLAGSNFQGDAMYPMCRVKTAISPNVFLGPDPLPSTPGSLDVCFGASGKRTTDVPPFTDEAYSLAIQSDGKIVVAGYSAVIAIFDRAMPMPLG
jgi:hypothetical protein